MSDRSDSIKQTPDVSHYMLSDDGFIPNNDQLPMLVYQSAFSFSDGDPAAVVEEVFSRNQWSGTWRNGIYAFPHYHSTAHEVLGIACGCAKVRLGGERGIILSVEPGDVVVIPAGVGHENLGSSSDLCVVGAYPPGQSWDLCRDPDVHQRAKQNIKRVPLPSTDPIYGIDGPLMKFWSPVKQESGD